MHATVENTGLFGISRGHQLLADNEPPPSPNNAYGAPRILRRGEHLFRCGDPVNHIHRVMGGILKSYFIHENGDEQVINFHLPGDLVGCDALADNLSAFSVVALNTSSVWREELPGQDETQEGNGISNRSMYVHMQDEILRLVRLLHMERCGTDARLARFLLDYANAQRDRGFSREEFHLPMGRKDLACYIGLAPETVSRIFSRLRNRSILRVENNHIWIVDHDALERVAN